MQLAIRYLVPVSLVIGCYGGTEPPRPDQVPQWRNVDVRGESIPAVDDSAVYNLEQETHILSAVRKVDGSLLWKRTLPTSKPNFDGYGLAVSAGVLVVGDMDLFGINPRTGAIIWQYQPSEGRSPGYGRFTTVNGIVYCGSTSGHIYAVDAATGSERWISQPLPDTSSIYWPELIDGVVYAGFTRFVGGMPPRGGAVAVDAATGRPIWATYSPDSPLTTQSENTDGVVVVGTKVFFGSNVGLHVADRSSGTVLSTLDLHFFGDRSPTPHAPFFVGGIVLVASGHGPVTGVDPVSLERKWQIFATSSVLSISGSDGVAYIPSFGRLVAVNAADGTIRWTFTSKPPGSSGEEFVAAPAVDESLVFLPGSRAVYALKK